MPALNFKKEFTGLVESGRKTQTIRRPRRYPIKPMDALYLYTGMRTKGCRKLGEGICHGVDPIGIFADGCIVRATWYSIQDMKIIARNDGFDCPEDFISFFLKNYSLPFWGRLIWWKLEDIEK